MELLELHYAQHEGTAKEWRTDGCTFGKINLIVGENASGKSRILNIVRGLANLVSGHTKLVFSSGNYRVVFDNAGTQVNYMLKYENQEVLKERLLVGKKTLLDRGNGGKGTIFAQRLGKSGQEMDFQTPITELACVSKRDSLQHPFLEDLFRWGQSTLHFYFGSAMGKGTYFIPREEDTPAKVDPKAPEVVTRMFQVGREQFGEEFTEAIKADMNSVGYDLESITIEPAEYLKVEPSIIRHPYCLVVKERDLPGKTDQMDMSQGMFRALSLIIQLAYSRLAVRPSCILVDDIGEGLDFERSSALIRLLLGKAQAAPAQLIMSTNDRFVMNAVPLKYWCIVRRVANTSKLYNYRNARELIEEFESIGLSNFDFFASQFYNKEQKDECPE